MATAKKTTKLSKSASSSEKRQPKSMKPSDEQNLEASTISNQSQNPSSSTSNPSSQTGQKNPEQDSSSSDSEDFVLANDPDLVDDDDLEDDETLHDEELEDDELEGESEEEDGEDLEEQVASEPRANTYRPAGAPEGRIIPVGEDVTFDADPHETYAVIKQDVYQEVRVRGSKRTSYRLVYSAGTSIPLNSLEKK